MPFDLISSVIKLKLAGSIGNEMTNLLERNAVKHKFISVGNHEFEGILLTEPTFCSICDELIFAIVGFRCRSCKLTIHKKCSKHLDQKCAKKLGATHHNHKFKKTIFALPTCCNHCGVLIKFNFMKFSIYQGLECDEDVGGCGMRVHYDCKELICRDCSTEDRKKSMSEVGTNKEARTIRNWSRITIKDFDILAQLGEGSFSKVYLAKHVASKQEFAIKVMKKTNQVISADPESTFTERRALELGRRYPFLNIVHCCFQSESRLYYVMEYVAGKNLLYHVNKGKFTEDRTRFYSAEIVLALKFLHRNGFVHRDLKLDNIILDEFGHCKLIDFGMSKELSPVNDMKTRTYCGTYEYMSPEMINGLEYGFSVDWWALGVSMFAMLAGMSPFGGEGDDMGKEIREKEVKIPQSLQLTEEAKSVIHGFLTKDPKERLGCNILDGLEEAISDHPFFFFEDVNGFKVEQWNSIEAKRMKPPPYRPTMADKEVIQMNNFDTANSLTPIDSKKLKKIEQDDFDNFSYYSESFQTS